MSIAAQAEALSEWYSAHYQDRRLPWRGDNEPSHRVAMVEGLLAQTRAPAVAALYDHVFDGVTFNTAWLNLDPNEREMRVAPLGLPHLKVNAVNSIAQALQDMQERPLGIEAETAVERLEAYPGIGPYTAGMLALLFGEGAAPVDGNVQRVGSRVDGDAERWIAELVNAALQLESKTGRPPAYEVVCAVLDVGASRCHLRESECAHCPLRRWCATVQTDGYSMCLPLASRPQAACFAVASYRFGGIHAWPLQPEDASRQYLGTPHRHEFHVEVGVAVRHDDREIEILDLKKRVRGFVVGRFGEHADSPSDRDLGGTSCEHLAAYMLERLGEVYGDRPRWCRVLEDGENGATTYWSM